MPVPTLRFPTSADRLDDAARIDRQFLAALDLLGVPYAILAADGTILERSPSATQMVGSAAVWQCVAAHARGVLKAERDALPSSGTSVTRVPTEDCTFDVTLARLVDGLPLRRYAAVLVPRQCRRDPAAGDRWGLTPREREIAGLLARGLSTKQIGASLGISANTARHHIEAIFAKLGVRSRAAAILIVRNGDAREPVALPAIGLLHG